MSELKELIDKYEVMDAERDAIGKAMDALRDQIAREHAPVKVGDIVNANGYSYSGKPMQVTRVVFKTRYRGFEFRATGQILKKDGTPGERYAEANYEVTA